MKKDNLDDLNEWLAVHLAQSYLYMKMKKDGDGLAWRLKKGDTTKDDFRALSWALKRIKEFFSLPKD